MSNSPLKASLVSEYKNFLAQYGVKGMRWGYRKDRSGKRRPTKEVLKENKKARKARQNESKSNNSQKNSISKMSDAELRQTVDRLRLEQTLLQMTAPPKASKSRVQSMLGDITYDVTRGAVTEVGKAVLSAYLRKELGKRTGLDLKGKK